MRAGQLRHRITLQRKSTAQDDYGQPVETWTDVATVWAQVEDLSGREWFAGQQIAAEVTTRVTIRYRSGIEPTMRVVVEGRTLDVSAVMDPNGRRRELVLMCREVV